MISDTGNEKNIFSSIHIWFLRVVSIMLTEKQSEKSIAHSRESEFSFSRIPLVQGDGLNQNQFERVLENLLFILENYNQRNSV